MSRDRDRRWNAPDSVDIGSPNPLLLCALPGQHLGARLWISGRALARFVAEGRCPAVRGARCIELGAGLGAVGIAAAMAGGASSVVLTDKAEMLPLLRRNIELNGLATSSGGCTCRAEELRWGEAPPREEWGAGGFDVVLAADVVYPTKDPTCLLALRETLFALCPPGSPAKLILGYHPRATEDQEFLHGELLPHFDCSFEEFVVPAAEMSAGEDFRCQVYTCCRRMA